MRVRKSVGWRMALCTGVLTMIYGCNGLFDPKSGEYEENLARWNSSGIEDYRFRSSRQCFCFGVDPVVVQVDSDTIVSVTDAATGDPVDPQFLDIYLTIDGIFAVIRDAIEQDVFELSVEYHETLGYPTRVDIDYQENTIDDEITYLASELVEFP